MIQVTKRARHIFTVEEYMGLQLAGRTELVFGFTDRLTMPVAAKGSNVIQRPRGVD